MFRIYVGNLSYSTSERTVRMLFETHGTIESISFPTDPQTGRQRGFAIVGMSAEPQARKAIAALNGHDVDGRRIAVSEARPVNVANQVAADQCGEPLRKSA